MENNNCTMKIGECTEKYEKPEMEVIEMSNENVICASCTNDCYLYGVPGWGGEGG